MGRDTPHQRFHRAAIDGLAEERAFRRLLGFGNVIQFCHPPRYRSGPTAQFSMHLFDRLCRQHDIEHRLTKPNHPWTNGQVERMSRTIKDATVERHHYADHPQLASHLELFLHAYNHARRLKMPEGHTAAEFIYQVWTKEPERFRTNPSHHTPGPYTWGQ